MIDITIRYLIGQLIMISIGLLCILFAFKTRIYVIGFFGFALIGIAIAYLIIDLGVLEYISYFLSPITQSAIWDYKVIDRP